LEAAILGFEREGDVPGSEIPQRYFDWLRRRDGRLMADVFEHNRLDILSLAALAAHLAELLDPDRENTRYHPGDRLAAARLFLARECTDEAVRLLDPLVGCANRETARDAARELSLHYKRARQWPAAAAIWEEMVGRDGNDLFALIELAKWCEHRRGDFTRALALAERACACERRLSPDECTDLAHRRERLERKLAGHKTTR
jgi:tetratricopeptide (TPR) repeat protein